MNFPNGSLVVFMYKHPLKKDKEGKPIPRRNAEGKILPVLEGRSGVWCALLYRGALPMALIRDYRDGKEKTFRIDRITKIRIAKTITAKYRKGEKVSKKVD